MDFSGKRLKKLNAVGSGAKWPLNLVHLGAAPLGALKTAISDRPMLRVLFLTRVTTKISQLTVLGSKGCQALLGVVG